MNHLKRAVSLVIVAAVLICSAIGLGTGASAAGTGIGLAEWCLNAYYSGWSYVWGGASPGAVDCSGLIYSYAGGYRTGFEPYADYIGYVSNGIPNIHGLGLATPTHYGVYVGNGMAVDARGSDYGVVYESVYNRYWEQYFKVPGVTYPTTGWENFNGEYFYYENGEYVTNTSRTIAGVTYNFSSSGASDKTPEDMSATTDTPAPAVSTPSEEESGVLKLGSSGDEVAKLQSRLSELGYYSGAIDGSFGSGTETAFMAFQQTAGLTVDGIAGPQSLELLYSENAPAAVQESAEPSETSQSEDNSEQASSQAEEASEEDEITYALGDTGDEIADMQQRLSELGYYSGEISGVFDEATEAALIAFQKNNGLFGTGTADPFSMTVLSFNDANRATEPEQEETSASEPTVAVLSTTLPLTAGITDSSTELTSEIITRTASFSAKALANLTTGSTAAQAIVPSDNADFVKWLAIVIAVMGVSFIIVMINETISERRKRAARRAARRRYR